MNKSFVLGLGYIIATSLLASFLADVTVGFSPIIWALILGLIAGNVFHLNKHIPKALVFGEKQLLAGAIILLGFQLKFAVIQSFLWILPVLAVMIVLSIVLGFKLAPRFGIDKECGLLLGAGNAICGTSAIATLAPIIKAKNYQTAISISVIHVLGTLALLAIPLLVPILKLENETWGVITGGTFQAVGQAVGAGYTVGTEAGDIATIIKLIRVLLLAPVVLFFSFRNKKQGEGQQIVKLPLFIFGFIATILIGNLFPVSSLVDLTEDLQDWLLIGAMVAIGSKIFYKDLIVSGPKALKLGLFIFAFQIAFIAATIGVKHLIV